MAVFGGDPYETGTISVTSGETTVTGVGTLWAPVVEVGDWLYQGGSIAPISEVTDSTHLDLMAPWAGGDLSGADYLILKMSPARYEPAITQQKVRALLSYFDGIGVFYFVAGDEPDVSLGDEGQFALKANDGPWKLWLRDGGEWVLQGSPAGVTPDGNYDAAKSYLIGDIVTFNDRAWVAQQPSTGQTPANGSAYWMPLSGEVSRLEIRISDIGKPGAFEAFVRELCATTVTFRENLPSAYAMVTVAPTADATFSIRKLTASDAEGAVDGPAEIAAATSFATMTILAGEKSGSFVCASDTEFAAGDILLIVAPASQDETLSGLSMSLIAYGN